MAGKQNLNRQSFYNYLVNTVGFTSANAQNILDTLDNAGKTTSIGQPDNVQWSSAERQVYNYLTKTLSFNKAAACAIMANIEAESGFVASKEVIDVNGLTSIGLFQWNGSRCDGFKSYCNARSMEYGAVSSQLEYLGYELNNGYYRHYLTMLSFEDSASGCYEASYYWASKFEVCQRSQWEKRASAAYALYESWD